ncbi:MAG: DNA-directed RNA polymerase [Deltaproteobacteria bacterium]|jgi:hypothetical protein|nr:DNA-directed RNA polymerase [Deltaproteobacteria bacterium]MBW2533914.1 DNA-directed RNA polymerase [Deltaproteobacteria bacterium]
MNSRLCSLGSLLLAAVLASALAGCGAGRIPFTHEIRTQYRLSDQELQNLQFYVSHTVTLRRELDATSRQVTGGHKLVLTTGKVIEEVVVEEETPGVAVAVGSDTITVSFDVGSAMVFALRNGEPVPSPGPSPSGPYAEPPDPFPGERVAHPEPEPVSGAPWGKYWVATESGSATVLFQGTLFDAVDDTLQAHLLIDADTLDEVVESRTVLPGRTLSHGPPWIRRGMANHVAGGERHSTLAL